MSQQAAQVDTSQVAELAEALRPAAVAEALQPIIRYADPMRQLARELPPTLTVTQVADLCHVTRQTVWVWIRDKVLPAYRMGGRVLILRDDLIRHLRPVEPGAADDAAASDTESE